MEELMKKIEELKVLMVDNNVTHIEINKFDHYDDDNFAVIHKFETSIHQDDHNKPWRYTRDYVGYSRRG